MYLLLYHDYIPLKKGKSNHFLVKWRLHGVMPHLYKLKFAVNFPAPFAPSQPELKYAHKTMTSIAIYDTTTLRHNLRHAVTPKRPNIGLRRFSLKQMISYDKWYWAHKLPSIDRWPWFMVNKQMHSLHFFSVVHYRRAFRVLIINRCVNYHTY